MTIEQFAVTERLEYLRGIMLRLAKARCTDPKNFYLPEKQRRQVKRLIAQQFGRRRP
jgi:hypothetical protein